SQPQLKRSKKPSNGESTQHIFFANVYNIPCAQAIHQVRFQRGSIKNWRIDTSSDVGWVNTQWVGMQKKEYEEWMSIDEDIPVAAALTVLEIRKGVCEQDQAIKGDDSDGDECVEENPPTNAEMRQALDILKRGVQHRSTNF
ncbi:hypothetical protein AVEN_12444-2-1, partial [Araneus ventricosus]